MKYAIGFVLYDPSENNIKHIKDCASCDCFAKVYIIDNTDDNSDEVYFEEKPLNFEYYRSPVNAGLSIAYNNMIEYAKRDGIDYLCIMDQDSEYPETEVREMIAFLENYRNDSFAILAPRTFPHIDLMKDYERKKIVSEVDYVINSGSFLNITLITKKNLRYDPNVFIDGVDYEMGMSIRESGLKVGIYEGSVFVQNLGYTDSDSHFNKHSTFRYGLIAKNRIYIYKKHYGIVFGAVYASLKNLFLVGRIILHEDEKADKVKIVLTETFGSKRKKVS